MTKEDEKKLDTLIDFAKSTNQDVKSVGADVKRVSEGQAELSKRFELHVQSDEHVHTGLGSANLAQDDRIVKLEKRADASGAHDITALEKKLDAERAAKREAEDKAQEKAEKIEQRWKGRAWTIFAFVIMGMISAGAGAYFGH